MCQVIPKVHLRVGKTVMTNPRQAKTPQHPRPSILAAPSQKVENADI